VSNRVRVIEDILRQAFSPVNLEVIDESHLHAGHEGAKSGGGHFSVTIISSSFEGKNPIQRHQMIYQALGALMKKEIHALSISAHDPDEL
jgi:BolA protein